MKIGIIGLGFVGNAIYQSLLLKNLKDNLIIYDKFKDGGIGTFEQTLTSNILFLALPTPFNKTKNVVGKILQIEPDVQSGFHWPYLLYIPETLRNL